MEPQDTSGLKCLQLLFKRFCRTINFPARLTQQVMQRYQADPVQELVDLAQNQQLRPEVISSSDVFRTYQGVALLRLKNGSWILVPNSHQIEDGQNVQIVDPSVGIKTLNVSADELHGKWGGEGIIFHNLTSVDTRSQTLLSSFVLIAHHNNTSLDIREIMHEFAVGNEEVGDHLFREIAAGYQFKIRRVKLSWKEMLGSGPVFPCIAT